MLKKAGHCGLYKCSLYFVAADSECHFAAGSCSFKVDLAVYVCVGPEE